MLLIFLFSSRPADISNEDSYRVGRIVCSIFYTGFDKLPEVEQIRTLESINFAVRKTAHASEYAILGFLLAIAANHKRNISIPLVIGIFYSCTDEFHQIFVVGRSGQVRDILIDSVGVLLGVFVVKLMEKKFWRYKYY